MTDIPITMMRGDHAVRGLSGDIILIESKIAMTKKYTFANLLNCKSKASV